MSSHRPNDAIIAVLSLFERTYDGHVSTFCPTGQSDMDLDGWRRLKGGSDQRWTRSIIESKWSPGGLPCGQRILRCALIAWS